MVELSNPKNFNENLNFKMSNMNMNIKIEYSMIIKFPTLTWVDGTKMNSYVPSFTKIVQYLKGVKKLVLLERVFLAYSLLI